ncbi:MAG: helix-turn-helix transcriptional regulator [Clostridia bacterium]|nr:helix-turn-helix transcriptional regulator [Clostridia bacterium]
MKRFTSETIKKLRKDEKFKKYAWWVGSYSVVILLSIVINLAGYTNAIGVIEQELAKTNASSIEHTKNIFDNYLQELDNISYNLIQSNSVTLLKNTNITPHKRSEYAGNLVQDIKNSDTNSRILKNAYIILKDQDICIDINGIVSLKTAYQMSFSTYYATQESWLNDLFDMSISGLKILTDKEGNQRLFLCRRYVNLNFSVYQAQTIGIMMEIDEISVNELLATLKSVDGEELYIVSNTGGMLFASQKTEQWPLEICAKEGTCVKTVFGQKQVISVVRSDIEELQYVRMLPNSIYLKNIRSVRIAFVLCYLLCIVFGGALVWLFSRINERNRRRMEEKLAEQKLYMREEILRRILERKLDVQRVDMDFLAGYNLQMTGKYFVVSVIDAILPEDTNEEDNTEALNKIQRYLAVYLPPMLKEEIYTYFCMAKNMAVVVFNLQKETSTLLTVCGLLSRLRSRLREELGLDFICAVSGMAIGIEELPKAFDEAIEAMNSRFLGQKDAIFIYDDGNELSDRYAYSGEMEHKLMNFLTLGDKKNATQVLEEIFSYNVTVKRINLKMLRVLTSEIISSLLKVAAQIDSDENIDFKELYLFSTQIYTIKQVDQAKNEILKYINLLCDLSANYAHTVGDARCTQILDYIQKNYADPDLNVNKMADVFGITTGWISKYFKDQVGGGMADYIVKFRLKKAKEQLKNPKKTIKQIAEDTGFSSATVFLRAFKRYEGITPGQYRELAGREED